MMPYRLELTRAVGPPAQVEIDEAGVLIASAGMLPMAANDQRDLVGYLVQVIDLMRRLALTKLEIKTIP